MPKRFYGCLIVILAWGLITVLLLGTESNPIQVTVKITPTMVSLQEPAPEEFRITISDVPGAHTPENINSSTIQIETISMKQIPDWPKTTRKFFAFKVDGSDLLNQVILPKISHMTPEPGTKVHISITVSGQFNDRTAFQGTFTMTILTEHEG